MSAKPRASSPTDTYEALYDHYIVALTQIGTSRCGMERRDAESLAHEILIASLRHTSRVNDLRGWLTGAMVSAAEKRTHAPKG
jgi:DNA-directed RNA polymerase specialized sigma24 family protein